jgi:DNA-binding transcriptional regulator YhcF (GntR family)
MALDITVDRKSSTPVFRQIIQAIEQSISSSSIKPGDKLPTERDLAAALGIARGTVTRAYTELTNRGIVSQVQGRGTIVAEQAGAAAGRKEKAQAMIRDLVDSLAGMRFTFPEMKAMVDLAVAEREEALASLGVAAVDCNPETLGMFERQIGLLSHTRVSTYLLDEISRDKDPGARLNGFDLVLTTSTHYADLHGLAPELDDKLVAVSVAPSPETILRLASVARDRRIGVLCESRTFFSIIQLRLADLRIPGALEALYAPRAPGALAEFARDRQVLIISPGHRASREEARALQAFTERGGSIVTFDYQIERGSLARVAERIRRALEGARQATAAVGLRALGTRAGR